MDLGLHRLALCLYVLLQTRWGQPVGSQRRPGPLSSCCGAPTTVRPQRHLLPGLPAPVWRALLLPV